MQNNSTVNPVTSSQSLFLDLVRLIAAQIVLVAHLSEWLYWPFAKNNPPSEGLMFYFGYLVYEPVLMGGFAVALFFVLSGFLISKSIYKLHHTTGFNLGDYILNRVARLLPTLLVAVLITLIVYFLISLFNLFGLPNYTLQDSTVSFPRSSANIKTSTIVVTSLFLNGMIGVPGINWGTMNNNGPLWSLAHEFWFYICAGLFVYGFLNKKKWPIIAAIGFILWQLIFSNFFWVTGFLVWILGAVSALGKCRRGVLPLLIIGSLLSIFFILKMNYGSPLSLFDRGICGISALLILNTGLAIFSDLNITSSVIKTGASYSFTLYAIHWPCIVLFVGLFGPQLSSWSPLFKTINYSLLFLGINLLAYFISRWSEDTPRWRKLISKIKIFSKASQ